MLNRCSGVALACVFFAFSLPASPGAQTKTAPELLSAWGCLSCHRIDGYGGTLAADLSRVGQRMNAVDIRIKLQPLPGQNKDALMPTYPEMPEREVELLTSYLAGRK